MKAVQNTIQYLVVFALLCLPASAQSSDNKAQTFAKDGLSFEYAEGWKLTDKSTPEAQHLILTREGSSVLLMVIAYRELITSPEQLAAARHNITESFVDDTARKLGAGGFNVKREPAQLKVGDDLADGVRLHGMVNKDSTTAEIYSYLGKLRFINLVYIRADKDNLPGDLVWTSLLRKLKVDPPIIGAKEGGGTGQEFPGQVLNGKALSLPPPDYPIAARRANVWGTVVVQVVIDESGNVMEARAVAGPLPLRDVAVKAARSAKFSPTKIYEVPVKVTGVITYNFAWAPL